MQWNSHENMLPLTSFTITTMFALCSFTMWDLAQVHHIINPYKFHIITLSEFHIISLAFITVTVMNNVYNYMVYNYIVYN